MSFVGEIINQPSHVKRKRIVELLDRYDKDSDSALVFLNADPDKELDPQSRIGFLYSVMTRYLIKSNDWSEHIELSQDIYDDWLELVVLLHDEFVENDADNFDTYVYENSISDGWNSFFDDLLIRIVKIDTIEANEVLNYVSSILEHIDVFTDIANGETLYIYRAAAEYSSRNFETLMLYLASNQSRPYVYRAVLPASTKNPKTFRFIMNEIQGYSWLIGDHFILEEVLMAENDEISGIYLDTIMVDRSHFLWLKDNFGETDFTKEDISNIEKLFLKREYLTALEAELQLDEGDPERGYPLPTLALRIVGQESERRWRKFK